MTRQYTEQDLRRLIPEGEFIFETFRSSAPGGQNVNKTESAVRLRWKPESSLTFEPEEKQLIIARLRNEKELQKRLHGRGIRINYDFTSDGELLVTSQDSRDQLQNKNHCVEKLFALLAEVLRPETERRPSKVPRGAKEQRLTEKKRVSEKKQSRARPYSRAEFE